MEMGRIAEMAMGRVSGMEMVGSWDEKDLKTVSMVDRDRRGGAVLVM